MQDSITQGMKGLLRGHQERMYDGIGPDLPLCDGSSTVDVENWMQKLEKLVTLLIMMFKTCYGKTTQ